MNMEQNTDQVDVAIVGGGPAGVIFAYLAARAGLKVKLLEAYADFNREFRGDTLNPLALTLLDEMGLMEEILQLPHGKVSSLRGSASVPYELNYNMLKSKYPYVMILSQSLFLDFMVEKAQQYGGFEVEMQARVTDLLEEDGKIKGVQYRNASGKFQSLCASLTIGADGRNSATRKLANIETELLTNQPDDVIWFRIPMDDSLDPVEDLVVRQDEYNSLFMFRRAYERDWQVGITVLKNGYKQMRSESIESFREHMTQLVPEFKERLQPLQWEDTAYLPVDLKRATQWYRDGLLLIGDAAHIMSPVGGVGINLAIRDAVVAANILVEPLKNNNLSTKHLAQVQSKVEWDIKITQNFQAAIQNGSKKVKNENSFGSKFGRKMIALMTQLPLVRTLPVRLLSFGLVKVKVDKSILKLRVEATS